MASRYGNRIICLISLTGILTMLYLWQRRKMSAQEIMEEFVTETDRGVRVASPHVYLGRHGSKKAKSGPWRVLCWITTYPGNFKVQLKSMIRTSWYDHCARSLQAAEAVHQTWGGQCDKFLAMSSAHRTENYPGMYSESEFEL